MALKWYVLRTNPQAEYLAAGALERDGFQVLLPCVNSPRPRAGHPDIPLFPGYLFLRFDPENDGWPTFRQLHRVSGWVTFDGVVPPVPEEAVAELTHRVESMNEGHGLWNQFNPGERVRVVCGNMESLAQVVEGAKSPQGRVQVLMDFMGRQVQAQVPWNSLHSVTDSPQGNNRPSRRTRGRGRWIRGFETRTLAYG